MAKSFIKINLLLKKVIISAGLTCFLVLLLISPPDGLGVEGARSLAVFSLCVSLWVTGLIPLAITSLLGMALIPLLGIFDAAESFSLFGDRAVFFILGALMLAAALYKTGLGARLAFFLLLHSNKKHSGIILGILLSSALLSCLMPEHAVAAMLFPIILELASSMGLKPKQSQLGKSMFIALAWGAIIGGVTTYLGGARNLLAVSLLEHNYGLSIGFFEWVSYVAPIPIVIIIIAYFLILTFFKNENENESIQDAFTNLQIKVKSLGSMSMVEIRLAVVMTVVIIFWLFFSNVIHISVTALLGGVAIFVLKVINWQDMVDYINWGVILMYGGAIVVATAITKTGATSWLAQILLSNLNLTPVIFFIIIALITIIITEGISNVAAVAIMIPLAFSMGDVLGLNPIAVTLLVAVPGGLAFCLPMGTPPNAIAYSSGFYNIGEVARIGVILNIVSVIVVVLVALFYWPLLNLNIIL